MKAKDVSCSPRVAWLKAHRLEDHLRSEIPHRDHVYEKEIAAHRGEVKALQFAHAFAAFLREKAIHLKREDILAGFAYRYTYNTTLPMDMPSDFDPTRRPPCDIDPFRESRECIAYYGFTEGEENYALMNTFALGVKNWLFKHWESGHILAGFPKLLEVGFPGLLREAQKAYEKNASPYTKAMAICMQAAVDYIARYEQKAALLYAAEPEGEYKESLLRIKNACTQLKEGAPADFFSAVQLVWIAHELLLVENEPSSLSLGRMDMYLYPFYARDMAAGTLSEQDAADIMDALFIKFAATIHSYQNVTVGGIGPDGKFAGNDLTLLILRSARKMRFDQPLICLRYAPDMGEEFWAESIALLKTGTGFPALFNDAVCIAAKERMGIAPEDAKNYALIGCVEMGTPSKEYSKTEVLRINLPMVLELMLSGGRCLVSGDAFPLGDPRDPDSFDDFNEFYGWYKRELAFFTELSARAINLLDPTVMQLYPTPYLSALMEGCMQKGLDVTGGGTVYNNTGINLCGMATVADELCAIKKVVFEDGFCTLSQLAAAMAADFEGCGELQARLKAAPKFGEDDAFADALMADLIAAISTQIEGFDNPRGGKWQLGLYTVEDHSKMGVHTGAGADGRNAGISLSNGFGASQGRGLKGPTAVANGVLKTDLSAATNGMVLDLKFAPAFLESEEHEQALRSLIEGYFAGGGMEIQINVVDRATLLEAQAHPELHEDLVVRVSGFSAFFTALMKETQDEIIARTEYNNM
ncbi:MAG: hypothetical protein IJP03_03780 [Christensenellaceae bacterium]|nr:hypothetical protein [Christensenellaceae bacterium]